MRYRLFEFAQLSSLQTWMIFKLRQEIFVLEQTCLFPEIDDRDPLALHLLGFTDDDAVERNLACYCRLFAPGVRFETPCISRVVVAKKHRQSGSGLALMQHAIAEVNRIFGKQNIRISAQQHLQPFYGQLGFTAYSQPYLEDDIWHLDMELQQT